MKNIKLLSLLILSSAILMNGCATILTGSSDNINFTSEPSGAKIVMDGLDIGNTPATLEIKRSGFKDKAITLKLDGYEDRTFLLQKEFNAIAILNFAGILGWFVDFATGSVMKYSDKSVELLPHPLRMKLISKLRLEKSRFNSESQVTFRSILI